MRIIDRWRLARLKRRTEQLLEERERLLRERAELLHLKTDRRWDLEAR